MLTCAGWPNGKKLASTCVQIWAQPKSTQVVASPRKSTQVGGETKRKLSPSPKLASTSESVWPAPSRCIWRYVKVFLRVCIFHFHFPAFRSLRVHVKILVYCLLVDKAVATIFQTDALLCGQKLRFYSTRPVRGGRACVRACINAWMKRTFLQLLNIFFSHRYCRFPERSSKSGFCEEHWPVGPSLCQGVLGPLSDVQRRWRRSQENRQLWQASLTPLTKRSGWQRDSLAYLSCSHVTRSLGMVYSWPRTAGADARVSNLWYFAFSI